MAPGLFSLAINHAPLVRQGYLPLALDWLVAIDAIDAPSGDSLGVRIALMTAGILFLGIGALIVTFVSGALQAMGQESIEILGRTRSLGGLSRFLLYLIGVAGEIIVLTSIYVVMPVGRLSRTRSAGVNR